MIKSAFFLILLSAMICGQQFAFAAEGENHRASSFQRKLVVGENTFRLWDGDAPGALGHEEKDIPTLTLYFPDEEIATGAAVVICPGGGYSILATYEGLDYAMWLNEQGIAGIVLKYRLASNGYHYPAPFQDVARAMRYVRAHAAEWGLDANKIGVMGSSAGGHVASWMLTHFDEGNPQAKDEIERQSSRPDFGILCYPVISFTDEMTHKGSRKNMIGEHPSQKLIKELSNELHVTSQTPPCFLWHTSEDQTVNVLNSIEFAASLAKAGVRFELHVYENGPHGQGLGAHGWNPEKRLPWTKECERWLREQGVRK